VGRHFHHFTGLVRRLARRISNFLTISVVFGLFQPAIRAEIILSPPSAFGPDYAQILVTNCTDTNFSYVLQSSTNLQDWSSVATNPVTTSYLPFVFPTPAPPVFYRVATVPFVVVPRFPLGIVCKSNLNVNAHSALVDSFDSMSVSYSSPATVPPSNNVVMIYDAAKARAGGNIGVNGVVVGGISVGNLSIFGHLQTGPGSASNNVQIGPNGVVGALDWTPIGNPQIEDLGTPTSWWTPDFNVNFPDVNAPILTAALNLLQPVVGGYIRLTGGNYVYSNSWNSNAAPFLITAPTTIWIKGSASGLNFVFGGTNASLVLYVGRPTSTGDTLSLAGNGTLNYPGYARNLQIFGLPSLTSMDLHGNLAWTATIYAPNATLTAGAGGNNTQDASGAIVAKSITLVGHWNFHYDESLKVMGPALN
jgi:hypothetical protein